MHGAPLLSLRGDGLGWPLAGALRSSGVEGFSASYSYVPLLAGGRHVRVCSIYPSVASSLAPRHTEQS